MARIQIRECKIIFLISQSKHMLWVLKRTVSMRHMFTLMVKKMISNIRSKNYAYLNLCHIANNLQQKQE